MKIIQRSNLKHIELVLAAGDIFEAKTEAIVNSEQTLSFAQQRLVKWANSVPLWRCNSVRTR
jgi:hypothetical protein